MTRSYEFRPDGAFFTYVCVRISETSSVQHFDMRYSPDGSTIEDEERLAYKVGQIAVGIHSALTKDRRDRVARKKR